MIKKNSPYEKNAKVLGTHANTYVAESDRKEEFEAHHRFEIQAFECISLQPDSAPTEPRRYR